MPTYSKVYKHLKRATIEITGELMPAVWRAETVEAKVELMQDWLNKASALYNLQVPEFEFRAYDTDGYMATGGGMYNPEENKITLFLKASVVTLLHEFKHMRQHKQGGYMYQNDEEKDARAWSVSLFRKTNPRAYRRAVRKGLLHFN